MLPPSSPLGETSLSFRELPEYSSAVLTQLSILVSTCTLDNYASKYRQIREILYTERGLVAVPHFYKQFYSRVLAQDFNRDTKTPLDLLVQLDLASLSTDLSRLDDFCIELKTAFELLGLVKGLQSDEYQDLVFLFLDHFSVEPVLAFIFVSRLITEETEKVRRFFEKSSSIVLEVFAKKKDHTDPVAEKLCLVLLDCVLKSPLFPFLHKLSTIYQFNAFDLNLPPVRAFLYQILEMSFRELLQGIGPENLLPAKLLPLLIHIKPEDAPASVALILAEVLIPGLQLLGTKAGDVTALTFVNNLPEAAAKGAQLQVCLKEVDNIQNYSLDWTAVFTKVQGYLQDSARRQSQPSVASITQLFSALDFRVGPLDCFLSAGWWFDKTLLYMMQTMFTQQGAFDVLGCRNLKLCFPTTSDAASPDGVLRFLSLARLEMQLMTRLDSQKLQPPALDATRKLDTWLVQFYEANLRTEPHNIVAGAVTLQEKPPYVADQIGKALAVMMDTPTDSAVPQLLLAVGRLAETSADADFAVGRLVEHVLHFKSSRAVHRAVAAAQHAGILATLLDCARKTDYASFVALALDATAYGYDIQAALEADLRTRPHNNVFTGLYDALEVRTLQDFEYMQERKPDSEVAPVITSNSEARGSKPLRVRTAYALLEVLKALQGVVDAERYKSLQLLFLTTYPRLINFGTGHDAAIEANEALHQCFPPIVEQEMKAYYSKLYNKEIEIRDLVDMLAKMKSSDDLHDQDVFVCMIHSLIDEYRFFSEYPLSALASTSLLFGALLQRDLIQGTTLSVALSFIWESCNQPQDLHMFKFAVQSLYNFKLRLHEYPKYCRHLLTCQLLSAHKRMYAIVQDASNGIPCDNTPGTSKDLPAGDPAPHPVYNSISAVKRTVGHVTQEHPREADSDRLLFFVNNMTADNMQERLPDVKDLVHEQYFAWFSNYLVTKRAKLEPNNHGLYANLVFALDNLILYEYVLDTTILEILHILTHFKDTTHERQNLRNLGAWLGKITLAHDRPLKRGHVALKYLLVEAFDMHTLPVVIPLVCRILEAASQSVVFRPPNPWILGILKVLTELYDCADLKLNLKFEIEVLLNAFGMKVKDVTPLTLIRTHNSNPEALAAMFGMRASDLSGLSLDDLGYVLYPLQPPTQPAAHMQQQLPMMGKPAGQPGHMATSEAPLQLDASFSNLKGNTVFVQNPNLRRAFQASLARAVRECAVPILSRVSEAVLTTTDFLIRKDFATEPEVSNFRKSYQTLAQHLAHSMVICSGRKILAETVEATMLQLLGLQVNPNELPLQELNTSIQVNIDLCVDIVENLAASNIAELIEERMRLQVTAREHHPAGTPFFDPAGSEYALLLPYPLGLPREGVRDVQLLVYTRFGTNSGAGTADQMGVTVPNVNFRQPHQQQQAPGPHPLLQPHPQLGIVRDTEQDFLNQERHITKADNNAGLEHWFNVVTQLCEKAIVMLDECSETLLLDMSPDSPVVQALLQATTICQRNAVKYPELLLKVAQYAVNCLFTQVHSSPLSNELYVILLDKLCEYSASTAKDVTWWMVHSVDQRKFNWPAILALISVQLVAPLKLDSLIRELIADSGNPMLVKFACSLLLNVFLQQNRQAGSGSKPLALRSEFACTLDVLAHYVPAEQDTEEAKVVIQLWRSLFDLLQTHKVPALPVSGDAATDAYVQAGYVFVEWCKLLGHLGPIKGLENQFVDRLLSLGLLTEPAQFAVFFRASTQIATTAFAAEHEIRARTQRETYLSADCLAKLVVRLLLRFPRDHVDECSEYFRHVMGVITLVLTVEHDLTQNIWNERAYYRLFLSLMCLWADACIVDANATSHMDLEFYATLADILLSLQPLLYAEFTFAWISLISHRMFLPKLVENRNTYTHATKLLCALLKFQKTFMHEKHDVLSVVQKAIFRIFVATAHDAPEFVSSCHYQLVPAVPPNYTQLRNIILAAAPTDVQAQTINPYAALKYEVDKMPGCEYIPYLHCQPVDDLLKCGLKKPVDNFLRIPAPALMRAIYSGIKLNHPKETTQYGLETVNFNVKLVEAVVIHTGLAVESDRTPSQSGFNSKSAQVTLLVDLLNYGNVEFRYHMICSVVDQLRFPSVTTQWFLSVAVYLMTTESAWNSASVYAEMQELWLRVLLERLVASKPHPWGLTVLVVFLLGSQEVDILALPCVQNAEEPIKAIFETLSRNVRCVSV